jgi:hypothetical protein
VRLNTGDPQNPLRRGESALAVAVVSVAAFAVPRLPQLAVLAIYLLLLYIAPGQMVDVIRDTWDSGAWFLSTLALAIPILAIFAHLALHPVEGNQVLFRDAVFATMPTTALVIMLYLWSGAGLAVALPVILVAGIFACVSGTIIDGDRQRWRKTAAGGVVIAFLGTVGLVALWPQGFPVAIGPFAVFTLGTSIIGLLAALAFLRPVLSAIYLLLCIFVPIANPYSVPLLPKLDRIDPPGLTLDDGFGIWLRSRGDLEDYAKNSRPYPVIVASAEGGGIYAAAHSYLVLTAMSEVCPNFPQHLFATVGVSGGSVGTLLYASIRNRNGVKLRAEPCLNRKRDLDVRPLQADLLSPTLANLLVLQAANFLVPGFRVFDQGMLASSIESALPGNKAISHPLMSGWDPASTSPATLFVSTNVANGSRLVFNPFAENVGITETYPVGANAYKDLPINYAAVISATFPWLTPTLLLKRGKDSDLILADGGYVENSGAETAIELIKRIRALNGAALPCPELPQLEGLNCSCKYKVAAAYDEAQDWSKCEIPISVAYLPMLGYSSSPAEERSAPSQSYAMDPISTMFRARNARESYSIQRSRADLVVGTDRSAVSGYFEHLLAVDDFNLPLGWKLSNRAIDLMMKNTARTDLCVYVDDDGAPQDTSSDNRPLSRAETIAADNACRMALLAEQLNPNRDARAIGRTGH